MPSIKTARDLVSRIAELIGCFVHDEFCDIHIVNGGDDFDRYELLIDTPAGRYPCQSITLIDNQIVLSVDPEKQQLTERQTFDALNEINDV